MKSSSLFFLLNQPKPIILISIKERFEQARAHTYGYRHGYQKGGEWILDYVTKKPLTAKAIVLRNAIKGHRATLLRSPDRVIGLGDAMRRDTYFQSFTLADSFVQSYVRDLRFILVVCLLQGFTIWWAQTHSLLLMRPDLCCSPHHLEVVRQATSCPMVQIGYDFCPHSLHCAQVIKDCSRPTETAFDPLGLNALRPYSKAISLSIMLGAVVVAQALGETVSTL